MSPTEWGVATVGNNSHSERRNMHPCPTHHKWHGLWLTPRGSPQRKVGTLEIRGLFYTNNYYMQTSCILYTSIYQYSWYLYADIFFRWSNTYIITYYMHIYIHIYPIYSYLPSKFPNMSLLRFWRSSTPTFAFAWHAQLSDTLLGLPTVFSTQIAVYYIYIYGCFQKQGYPKMDGL